MILMVTGLALVLLAFAPQWWAQRTFQRHAEPLERIPGTGGELARHLLDRFGMQEVKVETCEPGADHYDPESRTVRLSPAHYDGRSLTAVAVAAHEVGHAIQHRHNDPRLALRTRMVRISASIQQIGAFAMTAAPLLMAFTRSPVVGGLVFMVGLASIASATVVHAVTLPVELDASFNKALPLLRSGYIEADDEPAVRSVLRAAALTYMAASLASLLNVWRWIAMLRRA